MRLWSIHPKFLDAKGIVALWREGLLAQKVLQNKTKGYKYHPQLIRFKSHPNPLGLIGAYLHVIYREAVRRGYRFDKSKIIEQRTRLHVPVTRGQVAYEFHHLRRKLKIRDKFFYAQLRACKKISLHPIFRVVAGDVESWEHPISNLSERNRLKHEIFQS